MILPRVMRPRLYDGGDRHGLRKRKERGWLIQFYSFNKCAVSQTREEKRAREI